MPVAIIQNGTTAAEKVGIGTVNTIQSVVLKFEFASYNCYRRSGKRCETKCCFYKELKSQHNQVLAYGKE
jgi:hypothetical protein